jgi:photosystem II stability/assembly factor-like uncharacterized protein
MTQYPPENEDEMTELETGNPIYAFAAAADFIPGSRGTAYAATASGLLTSQDGGKTWSDALASLALREALPVTSLAVIHDPQSSGPQAHQTVIAGSMGGLFRSIDSGQTWQMLVFPSPPPTVSALACSPKAHEDDLIFAGTMEDGVFTSQDGGRHWAAWNFGLLDLNVMSLAISPNFSNDETLFAGTETGIFRSTNGGRAWRDIELPFGFDAVLSLTLSPDFEKDQTLYAGTESSGVWISADSGKTWQPLGAFEEPVNAILLSHTADAAHQIVVVTSSEIWRSEDGQAWQPCLPEEYAGQELSAFLAPQGIAPGAVALAGFVDGQIVSFSI